MGSYGGRGGVSNVPRASTVEDFLLVRADSVAMLHVANIGGSDLSVDSLSLPETFRTSRRDFPYAISPGASLTFLIVYLPADVHDVRDTLFVHHGDQYQQPMAVPVHGLSGARISGELTGVLTAAGGPYRLVGDVAVPAGSTLRIEPGVRVFADARAVFRVDGAIHAAGTETDSIIFERGIAETWGGFVLSSTDTADFSYFRVSDGTADRGDGSDPCDRMGGGMCVSQAGPALTISHTVFSRNAARQGGGGLSVSSGTSFRISECRMADNTAESVAALSAAVDSLFVEDVDFVANSNSLYGALLYGGADTAVVVGCTFRDHVVSVGSIVGGMGRRTTFEDCSFQGNRVVPGTSSAIVSFRAEVHKERDHTSPELSFIFIDDRPISRQLMKGCTFRDNAGPLVTVDGDSLCHVSIESCRFESNSSGTIFDLRGRSSPEGFPITRMRPYIGIRNTVVADNDFSGSSGVAASIANVEMTNCTLARNRWQTGGRPGSSGALMSWGAGGVVNSLIWGNTVDQAVNSGADIRYSLVQGGLAGIGNLDADPMFADTLAGDYSLLPGSPCIDAGDPSFPLDTDGSRVDIGASAFLNPEVLTDLRADRPGRFALGKAFPNPFNPLTTIPFEVPAAGDARLDVYDITGRHVRTLADRHALAGQHSAVWDGTDDAGRAAGSGVYIVRLDYRGDARHLQTNLHAVRVRRMLLVR